jgi:Zn-dependent protease with chaperone function
MHLVMILVSLALAIYLRCGNCNYTGNWLERWQKGLLLFLFPQLLILMTALAIVCMGPQGKMVGLQAGWFSYLLALGFLGLAIFSVLKLAIEGWISLRQIRSYSQINLDGKLARILDKDFPFIAQIGFWQPELIVSQGLLNTLDKTHLDAVLAHEQAHYYYRDTFWFFLLGWLRRLTFWLPNTEVLWEELLILREIRADKWAASQVDNLVLAESLLFVVSSGMILSEDFTAGFSYSVSRQRLTERIDALLAEPESSVESSFWVWSWVFLVFLPLVTLPFHR